jgi:hypothetical protein
MRNESTTGLHEIGALGSVSALENTKRGMKGGAQPQKEE